MYYVVVCIWFCVCLCVCVCVCFTFRDVRDRSNAQDFIIQDVKGETVGRMPGTVNGQQMIIQNCQVVTTLSRSSLSSFFFIFLFFYPYQYHMDLCNESCLSSWPAYQS